MALRLPSPPSLLKAMVFCYLKNHTISSLTHQNDINIILTQLCRDGRLKDAIHILNTTNSDTHYCLRLSTCLQLLQTCIAHNGLPEGKLLHSLINRIRLKFSPPTNKFLQDRLIHMYVNCASLAGARDVFDCMIERDIFTWNNIISGYQKHGFPRQALTLFHQMQQTSAVVRPDQFTFSSFLKACANLGDVLQGLYTHQRLFKSGFLSHVVVANTLVDMYAKCGSVEKARELFDNMHGADTVTWTAMIVGYAKNRDVERACELFNKMPDRDAVSWTAMIAGYAQNGFSEKALQTFKQMQLSDVKPNSATFASILPACATVGALEEGMDIHQRVVENGFCSNVVVVNALIDMYAKCGRIHNAQELFEKMHYANTVSWNATIAGYAQNGYLERARELFDKMPHRDAVSWTAMISGYAQNGFSEKALESFKQMQLSDVKPNSITFTSILPACATMGALEEGMDIYKIVVENGFSSNIVVVNALIDMFAKCGRIHKARELFDKMHDADTVSWNAMIAGYAQNGFSEKALEAFKQMQLSDVKPNSVTFASILPACATMGALEEGMGVHQRVLENGFSLNIEVVNALIDMYAKCGRIHHARQLFDKMHDANTVSWNVMIGGYAIHGYSKDALKIFYLMKHLGTNPNSITFVCLLLACSHSGLVDEGCKYFNSMSGSYCIIPGMKHYTCIVDLLGRAGHLEEALNFIVKMPLNPDVGLWLCLLGACRSYKNAGIGEFVTTILFLLEPENASSCVLLSNIYADMGSWEDVQRVRTLMKDTRIKKIPGCSWIEVHKRIHAFLVEDKSHPQTQDIYGKLEKLSSEMKAAAYIPNTILALHDVELDDKEFVLC